ncbi:MAG: glycosyltransferase family 9 protein [Cyanobacteria bacterium SZAS LIN-3]|nr:glycosyltransferase family 9 protein [Cyanobacteria bacterium SZAS LIN-3]
MQSFGNIVICHPAAIGDAMLATPVAAALKLNFPGAKISYWSHPSLRPLVLGLCPSIDEFVDFNKELGFFEQRKLLQSMGPDLFVDLSNSSRAQYLTLFTRTNVVRYEKSRSNSFGQQHAVGNFLETIRPICQDIPENLFPTIFPDAIAEELVPKLVASNKLEYKPLIGIVPGVGMHRPHRAWLPDGWIYLIRHILERRTHIPILIGGSDDFEVAQHINSEVGNSCLNLCGQLKLDETAAMLKCCDVVVSGDTGPAHIAVAVGTPVIGLYGPTIPARSGPYGYFDYCLDQSPNCSCIGEKYCRLANPNGPGECMSRIMLTEVIEKLHRVLGESTSQDVALEADADVLDGLRLDPGILKELQEEAALHPDGTRETDLPIE